jgi:hypothetical protein
MTLHVAYANRWLALHLGDRLATRAGEEWDPAANKTIVYLARDALVSIG